MTVRRVEHLLSDLYGFLKNAGNSSLLSQRVPEIVVDLDEASRSLLRKCRMVELESLIPGKSYFVFTRGKNISRPINKTLFNIELPSLHSSLYKNHRMAELTREETGILLYTLSMSFCAAIDLLSVGNKKTPATFFEKYIGNLFARELGVQPTNELEMLNDDSLATDYIFKTAGGKADLHLQIKLSTREWTLPLG